MIVEMTSPLTGKVNQMDLPITLEQLNRWRNGELIQNVFPHLTADEREFLMTGLYQDKEWNEYLGLCPACEWPIEECICDYDH
jgi:hypothetical protein